jgi:Transposase
MGLAIKYRMASGIPAECPAEGKEIVMRWVHLGLKWPDIYPDCDRPHRITKSIMQRSSAPHRMTWARSYPRLWSRQLRGGDWEEDGVTWSGRHPGPTAVCSADGTPTSCASSITRGMGVALAASPSIPRLRCPHGAEAGGVMPVVPPLCCGIEVHQAPRTAGRRRVDTDGQVTPDGRALAPTDDAWLTVSPWWTEAQGPVVALESPGVYGRPVSHVLVGTVAVLVGHAQAMRRRPGQKTDQAEARWMAELWAHGRLRPRVIPPPPIPALRDRTRTRVALIQARTPATTRVVKVLEDTTIQLTRVVSALVGRSGRRLLAALVAGERAPNTLAALARGVLRRQQAPLERALTGQCTAPQAWLIPGA